MPVSSGEIFAFSAYLEKTMWLPADALLWKWSDVETSLESQPHNVQGTLALGSPHTADLATIAPGLSLVIQVLKPGESTKPHRHSFWHLYIVRSGSGEARLGNEDNRKRIAEGDVLFTPAWCTHAVDNREGRAPLVLLRLQNLPQNAELGTLAREDGGELKHIYASESTAAA
jgi:gentisate 1,2-dioxygenase